MRLFSSRGLHPRGDLGQNFLIDLNLLEFVVDQARLTKKDVVLEVGAGTGGMTAYLTDLAAQVVSVEYDETVCQIARENLTDRNNLRLLQQDVLHNKNTISATVFEALRAAMADEDRDRRALRGEPLPGADPFPELPPLSIKLVANLPYHVATPVISNLLFDAVPWSRMVVTVQYEMAERMAAAPGTREYSAFSIWLQSQAHVRILKKLPPHCFWPRPKIDSAIVLVEPNSERRTQVADRPFFHNFVRDMFTLRRKHLKVALKHIAPEAAGVLSEFEWPETVRGESLSVDDWIRLSNRVVRAGRPAAAPSPKSVADQE